MGQDFKLIALMCGPMAERYLVGAPGSSLGPIVVVGHHFHWILDGGGTYRVNGKAYAARPDDVFLFQPHQLVKWDNDPLNPTVGRNISLYAEPSDDWPAPRRWPVRRHMPDNDIIRPLFEYIIGNAPDHPDAKTLPHLEAAVRALMAAFICGVVERPPISPHSYPAPVRRVLGYLAEGMATSPGEKVTLDELASVGGISRGHLCRMFRELVGYSPLEVFYLYRVTRSLIGLNAGKTVETLAYELGFTDAPHYVRRFTAYFGKTPGQMRQAMSKGYSPKMPNLPNMG